MGRSENLTTESSGGAAEQGVTPPRNSQLRSNHYDAFFSFFFFAFR